MRTCACTVYECRSCEQAMQVYLQSAVCLVSIFALVLIPEGCLHACPLQLRSHALAMLQ